MLRKWIVPALAGTVIGCAPVAPVGSTVEQVLGPAVEESRPSPVTARLIGSTLAEVSTAGSGKWLAMATVDRRVPGWITDQETGVSTQVELRPLQGDGIDRISLDALRALGIDQARLVIVDVYYDVSALRLSD